MLQTKDFTAHPRFLLRRARVRVGRQRSSSSGCGDEPRRRRPGDGDAPSRRQPATMQARQKARQNCSGSATTTAARQHRRRIHYLRLSWQHRRRRTSTAAVQWQGQQPTRQQESRALRLASGLLQAPKAMLSPTRRCPPTHPHHSRHRRGRLSLAVHLPPA